MITMTFAEYLTVILTSGAATVAIYEAILWCTRRVLDRFAAE